MKSVTQMSTYSPPDSSCLLAPPDTLTAEQKRMWSLLVRADTDVGGNSDPGNMGSLIEQIQSVAGTDVDGEPFCEEVIAVALRSTLFDVDKALRNIDVAGNPDPIAEA